MRGEDCINLGFGRLRGLFADMKMRDIHCINLGFDHLRGIMHESGAESYDCINLESGTLRGLNKRHHRHRPIVPTWELSTFEDYRGETA